MKKIVLITLALFLSISVCDAQGNKKSPEPKKSAPAPKPEPIKYKGNDIKSFSQWVEKELRDDFAKLRREGAKVFGTIIVNFEVLPDGKIWPVKNQDTKAPLMLLDRKVNAAINNLITKQKWDTKPLTKRKKYSFKLEF